MERSRGQIILVAAFALAVVFVALALILNTAIFTENLATRETVDEHDAIDLRATATDTGDVLLRATNENESLNHDSSTLVGTYRDRIRAYSQAEINHSLTRGAVHHVRLDGTHNGTMLRQTNDTTFESAGGDNTWPVSSGVTNVRRGQITVTNASTSTPVVFNATNGSASWSVSVQGSADGYNVTVDPVAGTTADRSVDGPAVVLRPTNGTVNGTEMDNLRVQSQFDGPFDLWIRNGSTATGTYRLIHDVPYADLDDSAFDGVDDPTAHPAIYNATLSVELSRTDLEYATNVTVEPNGPEPR
ncbi:DUF7261 family protein [Halodesulfurarchaeum formicicum]|uniref:Uncharacterized protein n=1 Tax=Halodesulfurarchaeum formicicum TaxID=1873524 RepID=A0A1J1ADH6_9EURY|nr:hypothetical protein [Halodesulfurarchaeum formicicum]APE95625.1 hypothetical protein HSR6_1177 [Halodesulfurarchaeum formicicum]